LHGAGIEIEDGQACEGEAGAVVLPTLEAVGSAVGDGRGHAMERGAVDAKLFVPGDDTGDAAHIFKSS
jgi:hypothetical protein